MKLPSQSGSMDNSLLTPLQRDVLEGLFGAGLGERGYYFTGGSALAEFYLKHRYSDDLDFFTRKPSLENQDLRLARRVFDELSLNVFRGTESHRFARYFVSGQETFQRLKVEFCLDAAAMMAPPQKRNSVVVDSLEDIAVNKVCAILSRSPSEPKDFCDLYFLLKDFAFRLEYLITRAREKEAAFDSEEGQLRFALALREAGNSELMPRMVRPLTRDELRAFLVPQADAIIMRLRPKGLNP